MLSCQQGCPLMGPLFCLTRQRIIEEARRNSSRGTPNFEPAFADDAFSRGDVGDVWASFQQELSLAEPYGLHSDPSKCNLYLRGDVFRFQALGVKIVSTTDAMMSKVPISQEFTMKNRRFPRVNANGYSHFPMPTLPFTSFGKEVHITRYSTGVVQCPSFAQCSGLPKTLSGTIDPQTPYPLAMDPSQIAHQSRGFGLLSPRLELGLDIVHLADLSFLASLRKCRLGIDALLPLFPCPQLQHLETSAIQHITNNFPNSPPPFTTPKKNLTMPKPSNISIPKPKPNCWTIWPTQQGAFNGLQCRRGWCLVEGNS